MKIRNPVGEIKEKRSKSKKKNPRIKTQPRIDKKLEGQLYYVPKFLFPIFIRKKS